MASTEMVGIQGWPHYYWVVVNILTLYEACSETPNRAGMPHSHFVGVESSSPRGFYCFCEWWLHYPCREESPDSLSSLFCHILVCMFGGGVGGTLL